jgi:hypothetical protein
MVITITAITTITITGTAGSGIANITAVTSAANTGGSDRFRSSDSGSDILCLACYG